MGARQKLVDHLTEFHPRIKVTSRDTSETLAKKHRHDHHYNWIESHVHSGLNRGANCRPPGWTTGGDVEARTDH